MIPDKSLVSYKNRPALVKSREGDRFVIVVLAKDPDRPSGAGKASLEFRVREKDLEFLHPGPCGEPDIEALGAAVPEGPAREAWELLSPGQALSLRELAELIWGDYSLRSAWDAFLLLKDGLYFSGNPQALYPRPAAELEAEEKKRSGREEESRERAAFMERLRARSLKTEDRRFLQDVEALACGKTEKSRTLREAGLEESPLRAHRLLLDTGFWTSRVNPHPLRLGLSLSSPSMIPGPPPPEDRLDLTHLEAFAIDSPWSTDPDDAISLESSPSGLLTLWVHVADPASSIGFDSPVEREARNRGATLYLPEGTSRMLAEESLSLFALNGSCAPEGSCPALSFKVVLAGDSRSREGPLEADIVPSRIKVTRLSYEEADAWGLAPEVSPAGGGSKAVLAALFALGERNLVRRRAAGAVFIDLPEVHIQVEGDRVLLEPIQPWKSAEMVRECMLLAGEGAAWWVLHRARELSGASLPFPYVGQEIGDLPSDPLPGYAGSWQLRRSMRPRVLSLKPSLHQGLGLDVYTQVTSPLRRYTDLLAHQQIRAVLRGAKALGEDEVLLRMAAAEAAMAAAVQAERASRIHWTLVYLEDKIGSSWEGVVLEKKGSLARLLIPALGLDTQLNLKRDARPNETVALSLVSLRIPEGEAVFSAL
ncbi:MAG: RNB domain-containing ribonuclease [Treponema sp.]|nr:RNB domain-containing ribonuclease [Treponema sp.]